MAEYNNYQKQLETRFGKSLKDILMDYYVIQDLGPSVTAKELDIPRNAVIYFTREFGLRELKHQNIKKKVFI